MPNRAKDSISSTISKLLFYDLLENNIYANKGAYHYNPKRGLSFSFNLKVYHTVLVPDSIEILRFPMQVLPHMAIASAVHR